jgi:hypothetical protein
MGVSGQNSRILVPVKIHRFLSRAKFWGKDIMLTWRWPKLDRMLNLGSEKTAEARNAG